MKESERILTVSATDSAGLHHLTLHYQGSGLGMTRTHDAPDPGAVLPSGAKTNQVSSQEAILWVINSTIRLQNEGGVWEIGSGFAPWMLELGRMAGLMPEVVRQFTPARPAARNRGR